MQLRRRPDVRRPARLGRQPADVQHRRRDAGAHLVERGLRRRARTYAGKVTAYDSPIYIADAALYLMNTQPDLGIKNPYALDEDQLAAAVDLLKKQKENVVGVLVGLPQGGPGLQDRRLRDRHDVAGHRHRSRRARAPVEAFLPDEGSTGWSDTWMISSKAKNPNCALRVDRLHHQPEGAGRGGGVLR